MSYYKELRQLQGFQSLKNEMRNKLFNIFKVNTYRSAVLPQLGQCKKDKKLFFHCVSMARGEKQINLEYVSDSIIYGT